MWYLSSHIISMTLQIQSIMIYIFVDGEIRRDT